MLRTYILLGLVALSFSMVVYDSHGPTVAVIEQKDQKLFPDLMEELAEVNKISLEQSSGIVFQAELIAGMWMTSLLSEKHDFPVDQQAIQTMLNDLASATVEALKTQNPKKHALLGVEPVSVSGSTSKLIRLETPHSTRELVIGYPSKHSNGSFVRLENDNQSMLIDRDIQLPASQEAWLQRPLLSLDTNSLKAIEIDSLPAITKELEDLPIEFLSALTKLDYLSALERQNVLLNWFTREPARVIKLTTNDNRHKLSLFENKESEQVWLLVDSEANIWQQHWAFELSAASASALMMSIEP